ncbi:MAG: dethiobiotin synthase [Alphaproteobacteria bacterium]|nr:dethiobiotin synthase [Alphaproteobacteria bacterium]
MNLFITGTDTDAGKTTVSAWICSKIETTYLKLVQTGNDSDSSVVRNFAPHTRILPEIYKLREPLSAYDAARIEGVNIDVKNFKTPHDKIVIEGAGGLCVPIADNFLMIDAIKKMNAGALLVSRSKLGMINHILLSTSALKNKNIPIIGIVISGNVEPQLVDTIEHFSSEKVLTILPESDNLKNLFAKTELPNEIMEVLK